MKKKIVCLMSLIAIGLVACGKNDKDNSGETDQGDKYTDKVVKYYEASSSKDFTLRFYEASPHVPYLDIKNFYDYFYHFNLNYSKNGDTYHYVSEGNYINVNPKDSTITYSNHMYFTIPRNGKEFIYYGVSDDPVYESLQPRVFDLAKYKIKLYADGDKVYVPLTLVSNISSGYEGVSIGYNQQDIYFIDAYGSVLDVPHSESSYPGYYSTIYSDSKRPNDLIQFSYNELCFAFDNLDGHPEHVNIGRDDLVSKGLDACLTEQVPEIKALLLSSDRDDYIAGQYLLFGIVLYDGGHGGAFYHPFNTDNYFNNIYSSNTRFQTLYSQYAEKANASYVAANSCYSAMVNTFGISSFNYYYYSGDIMYIGFYQFDVDYDGWATYYADKTQPLPDDYITFILSSLAVAKSNGVKNIVFDITYNGGGDTACLQALDSLITKSDSYFRTIDRVHNTSSSTKFSFDFNFDGVINQADYDAIDFGFNYAIMTSACSFSCANAFPMYAHDEGIMIIGEQSGGGSCCVGIMHTVDGIPYRTSSTLMLTNKYYQECDSGILVDANLKVGNSYTKFYDISYVSGLMDDFYA